jgi:uncharacterized protein (DUF302 family)
MGKQRKKTKTDGKQSLSKIRQLSMRQCLNFCRISIYEEGGKTILATLKPTTLLAMFNTPQLEAVAQEVEDTIVKIMKEAASG